MVVETFDGATFGTNIRRAGRLTEDVRNRARRTVVKIGLDQNLDSSSIAEVLAMLGILRHEEGCVCGDC